MRTILRIAVAVIVISAVLVVVWAIQGDIGM